MYCYLIYRFVKLKNLIIIYIGFRVFVIDKRLFLIVKCNL